MKPIRCLFILRERGEPYDYNTQPHTKDWQSKGFTGLSNSVRYVAQMLNEIGVEAKTITVANNNTIDAAVHSYQPTHVIIEAFWVVPTKLPVLAKLHPTVKWNLRVHSQIPFMSMEGIAIGWIYDYLGQPNVTVSANSLRLQTDLQNLTGQVIPYTPNYYPIVPLVPRTGLPADNAIDVGCFGAIRPLKNQLAQAVAAIQFANALNVSMRFHINGDRVEMKGDPILHNLEALFLNNPKHSLIQHGWMDGPEFIALCRTMDLGMQVSFSETFNLVSADLVVGDVPIVVSPEISWVDPSFQADPTSVPDILAKMHVAWATRLVDLHHLNYQGLIAYDAASEVAWPIALQQMVTLPGAMEHPPQMKMTSQAAQRSAHRLR